MKIEVGGKYELNNGDVVECVEGPDKDGDFRMDNTYWYGPDGVFHGAGEFHYKSVKRRVNNILPFRIISRASETPKLWRDMTDAEKGALLLARHEGKVIECHVYGKWEKDLLFDPVASPEITYRVRPEPVRETHAIRLMWDGADMPIAYGTIETEDGKPDCATIKMEYV